MNKKISILLKEYFEADRTESRLYGIQVNKSTPVKPSACSWEIHTDPERFHRVYKFNARARLKDFVNEILNLEDEINHHGDMKISYDEVSISVYTHDINRITELDQEYTKHVDLIYRDVLDFEYR